MTSLYSNLLSYKVEWSCKPYISSLGLINSVMDTNTIFFLDARAKKSVSPKNHRSFPKFDLDHGTNFDQKKEQEPQ